MPRKKSDEISIFMPPTQDCPTVTIRRITTSELDDDCARSISEEILIEKKGSDEFTFDFFTSNVRLEIKRASGATEAFTWEPDEFQCFREFENDIRSRLVELVDIEFSSFFESAMENLIQRIRDSCVRVDIEEFEIDRVPSEADLAIEGIRDSLGLKGLRQPSRRLANLQRVDLRRVSRDQRHPFRLSRLISKIPELLEVILE